MNASPAASSTADQRFDVVIVGAGGAGVAAAIEAAERGARVALVDAAPVFGGTASGAGGATCIADSPLQERQGIVDSVDIALEDWLRWGGPTADAVWAERYLRASRPLLYERMSELGVRWIEVGRQEGNRVPRWHRPEGGGKQVMAILEARARAFPGITWLFAHRATSLVTTDGRVTGVILTNDRGDVELTAPAILVSSGGFNNSAEMVAEHAGEAAGAERILLGGGPGARGEGHRMLQAVGAQFTQLDAVWMYPYGSPDYRHPETGRGLAIRSLAGEIWVNDEGNRFHDETLRGGASGTRALLAQPNGRCWSVTDARVASRLTIGDPYYANGNDPIQDRIDAFVRDSPYVVTAPTIAELAARIGVDATNLAAAVDDLNSAIRAGLDRDPVTGKPLAGMAAIEDGPYTAIRQYPMARKNLGGVRTDLDCRVLDLDGRPIPGLYAAGEVAGMAGGHINGSAALEGTMFGPSIFSGIVAGRAVIA